MKILPWYYTGRDQPARAAELKEALAAEREADGDTTGTPIRDGRMDGMRQVPVGRHRKKDKPAAGGELGEAELLHRIPGAAASGRRERQGLSCD